MIDRINGRIAGLVAAVVVLAVLLLGWYAFVSPQRSKAANLENQIGTVQGQISSTQAYLRDPATKGYAKELRRLKLAVPDDIQMSQILRELSAAAQRAGIQINTITPGALVASTGGQAVPIALTVQGHYFRLANFVHILRTRANVAGKHVQVAGRLYSVDGIQFTGGAPGSSGTTSSNSTSSNSVIGATVNLNAFVATPAPPPPPPTTDTTSS